MATTVYTYNDKVLKNVATDKWLKKAVESTPFDSVTVGDQIWTAADISLTDDGTGITSTNLTVNGVNLGTHYTYTLAAIERLLSTTIIGWHLPTEEEYRTLINNNMASIMSTDGSWGTSGVTPTNTTGFTATPTASSWGTTSARWLTSSNNCLLLQNGSPTVYTFDSISQSTLYSVRLIKDA